MDNVELILMELQKINRRFDQVDDRFNKLEGKVDHLENEFTNLRVEMRGEFNQLKEVFIDIFTTTSKELNTVKVRIFDVEEKVKSSIFFK